jgi:hypothetical protein
MTYTKHPMAPMKRRRAPAMGDAIDDAWALFFGEPADPTDTTDSVNQTATGTSTSSADFSSVGGVCKPANFPALSAVKEFQNQLNRVAQVKKFSKVSVDGSVGPATLALFRQVQAASAGQVMGDASSCMGVAPDVDVIGAQVRVLADSLGAPSTVSGPALSVPIPTIVTKSGKTVVDPSAGGAVGALAGMSSIEKVALLAVAGGVGYLLLSGRKKRRA